MKLLAFIPAPSAGIELIRFHEIFLRHAHVIEIESHQRALRQKISAQLHVIFHGAARGQRDGIDPQRLLDAVLQKRHLVDGLDRRRRLRSQHFVHFLLQLTQVLWIPHQIVKGPDEGVGGGVDAGQQQLGDVSHDFGIGQLLVE